MHQSIDDLKRGSQKPKRKILSPLSWPISVTLLIIVYYGSAFVLFYEHDICTKTRLKETKTSPKKSSFQRPRWPWKKLIGAANRQSPVVTRKFLPLCHRNTRLGCVLTNAKTTPSIRESRWILSFDTRSSVIGWDISSHFFSQSDSEEVTEDHILTWPCAFFCTFSLDTLRFLMLWG